MEKILVLYDTMTGNCKRFANKLPSEFRCCHISEYDGISSFVLITYTINFGQVPKNTKLFLDKYHTKMLGISCSGNKIWGSSYAVAADIISYKYGVPIISKFELQGNEEDVKNFIRRTKEIVKMD